MVTAVVIELALLSGIWAWLSGEVAKTSNVRGLVQMIGAALLGAFLVNILQLIFGNVWGRQSSQPTPSQPDTNPETVVRAGTVVRRTRITGKENIARVTKGDALVEDTQIDGENNKFSVTDDANPPSSPQQNNSPNP
ncbi:hypothetical protein H6G97_31705 [Nostoc flagelliforme FACHB-838]|uniref:NfeD-like C-terminal domain-containing protein n=1 Tax=Nostoc flagelliforme FACHB-838 TaxID=2692904 RepID=A0ABR8DX98_9NOSO|nr:hypothetical protein [Nostoc flagelliforme]MBD2533869.1 hypothetical protein [Nostoc flagelliforme FACHB-838]